MSRQCLIQCIQLGARSCTDDAGNTQVSAIFTSAHGYRRGIEIRRVTLNDMKRGLRKTRLCFAHDFDGKITGIFDQGWLLSHGAVNLIYGNARRRSDQDCCESVT